MKVTWGDESDYDEKGNPKPEAIKRALEHKKPLPWWAIVCLAVSVPALASSGIKPLFGEVVANIISAALFIYIVAYANIDIVRRITARLARWTGLLP